MARPRKYANAAEKQAAFRARYVMREIRLKHETAESIDGIAEAIDLPFTEVVNQLLQFALANRAWHTAPRFTSLLPRKTNPIEMEFMGKSYETDTKGNVWLLDEMGERVKKVPQTTIGK